MRVRGVQAVPAPGVIDVLPTPIGQVVVVVIADSTETQSRPVDSTLRCVVVDDIDDDLEPCGVQRLDHVLELADLATPAAGGGVPGVGSEEADRVVAPVVRQPTLQQVHFGDEVMDGE